ncbi:ABC transporter ATP-binding protein [Propionibacteriaceae bacterium Y2011]
MDVARTRIPGLQVTDLTVRLAEREILAGVDLTVTAGAITVLLGPNGAGKTTLVRCCTGLVPPTSGTVSVCGTTPARAAAEGRVGLMPQSTGAWSGIKAGELLTYLAGMYANPLPTEPLVELLNLTDCRTTPYRRLSGGQQQAVNLAGAIIGRPDLVFLDEPTAGMDPRARRTTWDLVASLRDAGVAVLLTTHAMDEATQLADQVVILDRGTVRTRGTVGELTTGGQSLEDVFLASTGPLR